MAHAFISYARNDAAFVERLSSGLRQASVNVWRDVDSILPGQQWRTEILDAVSGAAAIIYVVSAHSVKSEWVLTELQAATQANQIPLFPIIIDDNGVRQIPAALRTIQYIDFRRDFQMALRSLVAALPRSVLTDMPVQSEHPKSKGYVFISYAECDSDFVGRLRQFLTRKGFAFWDYQSSDRNYHTQLFLELEDAIKGASATLSVLSPDWKQSKWAPKEYLFSEDVGIPVLLLMVREMGPTLVIAGMPYIDFVQDEEQGFGKLENDLRRKGLI